MPKLKVKIYGAKDLCFHQEEGFFDPSCIVKLNDQTVTLKHSKFPDRRTKNKNIVWDKGVLFTEIPLPYLKEETSKSESSIMRSSKGKRKSVEKDLAIKITIADRLDDGSQVEIGHTEISLAMLTRGKPLASWFALENVPSGKVKVTLTALDFGKLDDDMLPSQKNVKEWRKSNPPPKLGQIMKSENILRTHLSIQPPLLKFRFFKQEEIKRRSEIGKGTFGVVYRGKVKLGNENHVVCIKDMNATSRSKIVDEWKKEVELMKFNECRYVCTVFGYSVNERRLTILMEYCSRGSLYDVLYKKPPKSLRYSLSKLLGNEHKKNTVRHFSLIQRLRLARHCVRGLCYLHSNHVIHCDLKSPNILVTSDYTCKLTDFGSAKLCSDNSRDTRGIGSPLWAAPETKTSQCSMPADVYSMGLVLYEIFQNKLPRWNRKLKIAVLPSEFEGMQIILPCASEDPMSRPTAGALLESLDNWVQSIIKDLFKSLDASVQKMIMGKDFGEMDPGDQINRLYNFLIGQVNITELDDIIDDLSITPTSPMLTQSCDDDSSDTISSM